MNLLLKDINEMALRVGPWKFNLNWDAQVKSFDGAAELTKLEGGKFSVKQALESDPPKYGLFQGDELVSIAQVNAVTIHGQKYQNVAAMYTPSEKRKNGYTTILLYSLKELNSIPLIVDDAIFDDGWQFINSIAKQHNTKFQSVKVLDKESGEIKDFTGDNPKRHDAYIIENDDMGFYRDYFGDRVYFNMFESEYE